MSLRSILLRFEQGISPKIPSKIVLPESFLTLRQEKDTFFLTHPKLSSPEKGAYFRSYSTSTKGSKSSETSILTEPQRSLLQPPKPPPSVWQIYFIDWLQRLRSYSKADKKLNVAQEAKEAAIAYNKLSDDDKEILKARARLFKDQYESDLAAWKRSLTPADIEHENAFRTAQRKSGKSRRKNIPDPNAPKRPMSAYLFFLQHIRADEKMSKDIFGDVVESTCQSVLAAAKWRSMTDEEKQSYFAQADSDKLRYEGEKKIYDERTQHQSGLSLLYYSSARIATNNSEESLIETRRFKS
ncbi:hypothetical protein Clacol_001447 [Clathrus columnatus]|uniref:HMG box domain-containing protein n=1 Tax=Clathrus columnatus TaxID=1419009 RepID=A0AAV4ZYA3_9AGAM|nr:hypothetical protein Clacol_001447 [Clathrus columnatus]